MSDWACDMTNWDAFRIIGVPILTGTLGFTIRHFWERRKIELEHKLEIMRDMTSTFHTLSNEHYSQLGQAAFNLKQILSRGDKGEASFFRLAKFWQQYERLPMLQLNDTLAEDTFTTLAKNMRTLMLNKAKFSEEDLIRLREGDINEKFADFKERIGMVSWLHDTYAKYQPFIQNKSDELQALLQCFSDMLFMEITCGKDPWYKQEELHKQANEALQNLCQLKHLDKDVKEQVSNYYIELLSKYEKRRIKVKTKLLKFFVKRSYKTKTRKRLKHMH